MATPYFWENDKICRRTMSEQRLNDPIENALWDANFVVKWGKIEESLIGF